VYLLYFATYHISRNDACHGFVSKHAADKDLLLQLKTWIHWNDTQH